MLMDRSLHKSDSVNTRVIEEDLNYFQRDSSRTQTNIPVNRWGMERLILCHREGIIHPYRTHTTTNATIFFYMLYIYCVRKNGLFPITVHAYWWLLAVKNTTYSTIKHVCASQSLTQTELPLYHFSLPFCYLLYRNYLHRWIIMSKCQKIIGN